MAAMRAVGYGHRLPAHANVREDDGEYVIELDVSDFLESELAIDVVGPRVTVRGEPGGGADDDAVAFRLHEQLEESFRLPDDADRRPDHGVLRPRDARVARPAVELEPRRVPIEHRSPFVGNPDARSLLKGGEMAVATPTDERAQGGGQAPAEALDGPVDGDRARGRQHGRLGHLHAAGRPRRRGRPRLDPGARLHRHRRDAARARVREPRPRAPAHGRAVLLRPARVRRLRRLPDGLGVLDRRLGRQRRHRRRVRRLPRRLLGRRQHDELAGRSSSRSARSGCSRS